MDSFSEMLKWVAIFIAVCAAVAFMLIIVARVVDFLSRNPAAASAFTWLWFSGLVFLEVSSISHEIALSILLAVTVILCWMGRKVFVAK